MESRCCAELRGEEARVQYYSQEHVAWKIDMTCRVVHCQACRILAQVNPGSRCQCRTQCMHSLCQ